LLVKGYFVMKSKGWQRGWEWKVERRQPFQEISLPFSRITRQEGLLNPIQTDLSYTSFLMRRYDWMYYSTGNRGPDKGVRWLGNFYFLSSGKMIWNSVTPFLKLNSHFQLLYQGHNQLQTYGSLVSLKSISGSKWVPRPYLII